MKERTHVGWREWVSLPDLGIERVKVKVDTGALTSALHGVDIEVVGTPEQPMVSFRIHPFQRNSKVEVRCLAPLLEYRLIRSSNGHRESRPCIQTPMTVGGHRWNVIVTLTNRSDMGFRMLIGRDALRGRFVVDPGRSFIHGTYRPPTDPTRPPAKKKKKRSA